MPPKGIHDVPGVELPFALERKYPDVGKQWGWHWLFPCRRVTVHTLPQPFATHLLEDGCAIRTIQVNFI